MLGIVNDPEVFAAGLALGALIGVVLERYVLVPIALLRVQARARVRRRER